MTTMSSAKVNAQSRFLRMRADMFFRLVVSEFRRRYGEVGRIPRGSYGHAEFVQVPLGAVRSRGAVFSDAVEIGRRGNACRAGPASFGNAVHVDAPRAAVPYERQVVPSVRRKRRNGRGGDVGHSSVERKFQRSGVVVEIEPHSPNGVVVSPEERGNPVGRGRVVPEFHREVVRSEYEGVSTGTEAVGRSVESDARVSKFFLAGRNCRRIDVFEIRFPFGVDDASVGERHEEDGSRHACRRRSRYAEISGVQRRSLYDSEVGNEPREIFRRGMSGRSDTDLRSSRVKDSRNGAGIDLRPVGVDLQRRSGAYEREMVPLVQGEIRADFR